MFYLFIIVVIAIAVGIRLESINDLAITRAKAKGEEPKLLSLTNPFHWLSTLFGMVGFLVGYTPYAARHTYEVTRTLALEAKKETLVAGVQTEKQFKHQKAVGAKIGNDIHFDAIKIAKEVNAQLAAEIAALK